VVAFAAQHYVANAEVFSACVDNKSWTFVHAADTYTCDHFANVNVCHNGACTDTPVGSLCGEAFNYPERNCCACGKALYEQSFGLVAPAANDILKSAGKIRDEAEKTASDLKKQAEKTASDLKDRAEKTASDLKKKAEEAAVKAAKAADKWADKAATDGIATAKGAAESAMKTAENLESKATLLAGNVQKTADSLADDLEKQIKQIVDTGNKKGMEQAMKEMKMSADEIKKRLHNAVKEQDKWNKWTVTGAADLTKDLEKDLQKIVADTQDDGMKKAIREMKMAQDDMKKQIHITVEDAAKTASLWKAAGETQIPADVTGAEGVSVLRVLLYASLIICTLMTCYAGVKRGFFSKCFGGKRVEGYEIIRDLDEDVEFDEDLRPTHESATVKPTKSEWSYGAVKRMAA